MSEPNQNGPDWYTPPSEMPKEVRFSPIYGIDAKGRAVEYRAKKDDKDEKSSGIGWLEVLIALVVVTKLLGLW